MKYILAVLALALSSTALADGDWYEMKKSKGNKLTSKLELKIGSFESVDIGAYKNLSIIARLTESNNAVTLVKLSVKDSDCAKKYGTMYTTEFNGTPITNSSFAFGGGNTGSTLAELICDINNERVKGSI
jgi:hypothetical protein